MKPFLCAFLLLISSQTFAGQVFKIEVSKDYAGYTDVDLRRRVWELERAVAQLQQKVFEMEMGRPNQAQAASWICRVEAMGEKFTAVGTSRAVAENDVMEKCKNSPKSGGGFHCGDVRCSQ